MRYLPRNRGTAFIAVLLVVAMFAAPAGAAWFDSTVDFKVNLQGRDMTDPAGDFILKYRSTYVQYPAGDPTIWVSLWHNKTWARDVRVSGYVYFNNNGWWQTGNYLNFNSSNTYYFRYQKNNNGYRVKGDVQVR